MKRALSEYLIRPLDEGFHPGRIAQISGNMMSPVRVAPALVGDTLAGTGDHAPAFITEALNGGVADAPAGAGQYDGAAPGSRNGQGHAGRGGLTLHLMAHVPEITFAEGTRGSKESLMFCL